MLCFRVGEAVRLDAETTCELRASKDGTRVQVAKVMQADGIGEAVDVQCVELPPAVLLALAAQIAPPPHEHTPPPMDEPGAEKPDGLPQPAAKRRTTKKVT